MSIFENIPQFVLIGLEIIILSAALGVVLIPNIVYAAFLLVVVLIGIAGLYILLNAEFLAAAQILIYVGAINILILFAIMLINNRLVIQSESKPRFAQFFGFILSLASFGIITRMILKTSWPKPPFVPQPLNLPLIGNHLFSDYLLPFEIVSLILFIALVGAVVLARKEKPSNLSSLGIAPFVASFSEPQNFSSDRSVDESFNRRDQGN